MNARQKFDLRWSTAPRHVGYPGQGETNDLDEKEVDFRGTPRQIIEEIRRVRRNIGAGTFLATRITRGDVVYRLDEMRQFVEEEVRR